MRRAVTIKHIVLSLAAMALLAMPSFATVGIVNEGVGTTTFQRNAENGTYSVNVRLSVGAAANISAMEANVTYNNTIFSDVSITDANAGGSIWETSVVNANYQTNGSVTTVKFMKASTNGDSWAVSAGQTPSIYTLTFKVKNNAVVGNTKIEFDTNYAKVQDAVTGNITGTLTNTTYTIALDQAAPTTSVVNGNVGGYYNAPVTVLLDTNETNDEATINYTTDGTVPNFTSGYYLRSSGNVTIPSGNNTLVITTLNYLSRDWAQDKSPNEESPVKTQVYYVDTQLPVISNVSYTAGPLATGYWAYVTFNVADNSGLLSGDPAVTFTGGAATKVSGTGVGQFVYRRQITSGDNDGTNHVDISITATDMAGNQDVNSIADAITLDFGAPSFTVTANPNPAAFLTWVTINVTASETLESPGYPTVVVSPGNAATYYSMNGTASTFRYFVTGNGWTATVPWLNSGSFGDETAPQVTAIIPTSGATAISITSDIVLRITDNITVVTSSIGITINGELAVLNGAGQGVTYSAFTMSVSTNGEVRVTLNPSINFVPLSRVTVNVSVLDNAGNNALYTYVFDTKAAGVHNVSYVPTRHYNEIQSALDDAQINQIIELDAGTYDQGVTINWPNTDGLTIRGASGTTSTNVIITGGKMHRIFNVNNTVNMSLSGLSILDGRVTDNNGAAFWCKLYVPITINLSTVIISGNWAITSGSATYGGAFYTYDPVNIFMTDSLAYNNYAYSGGFTSGGRWNVNGSKINNNRGGYNAVAAGNQWTVNNSMFSGNYAVLNAGVLNGCQISINNCVFSGNYNTGSNPEGNGGVFVGCTGLISNSTFNMNSAGYQGGVLYTSTVTINNCTFSKNSARERGGVVAGYGSKVVASNSAFTMNTASMGGVADQGRWTVDSCMFGENTVTGAYGHGGVMSNGSWDVNNSVFNGNKATARGGLVYQTVVTMDNSTIYASSANIGAVAYGGSWKSVNTIFWGNKENNVTKNDLVSTTVNLSYCSVSTVNYASGNAELVADNLVIGDPKFQSTVSTNAKFLQLTYGSACIDTGTSITTVTTDIRGYARPLSSGYDMGAYEYEELGLTEFAPAKSSTMNYQITANIVFRVRDYLHASANITLGITVNGTSYTSYVRATDNSTTGASDFYAIFDVNDFSYDATVNVTVNAKCTGVTVQDRYNFFVRDYMPPTINAFDPARDATLVSITNNIVIRVTDNISIVTASLQVTVNDCPAVVNGVGVAPTFSSVVFNAMTGGYLVSIDPSINFDPSSRVTVDVAVSDKEGNVVYLVYGFDTKTAGVHNISYVPNRHYNEIQSALTDALADHVIVLDAGTYDQGVTINWPNTNGLTLRGADGTTSTNVLISGGKKHRIFTINNSVSLSITGLTVLDASANAVGGVIYVTPNRSVTINIRDVIASGNRSTSYGGVISAASANVFMVNSVFMNNAGTYGGVGYNGSFSVDNCILKGNTVSGGGAVSYYGSWTVSGSIVSGNRNTGGAGGVAYLTNWDVNTTTFNENYAYDAGGIVLGSGAQYGAWRVVNCTFLDNKGYGGSISSAASWNVKSSIFKGNYSYTTAGVALSSVWTVDNSVFSENSAAGNGAVMNGGIWSINNSTFVRNSASGLGGVAYSGTCNAVNTVFWNNKGNNLVTNEFYNCSRVSLSYCIVSTVNFVTGSTTSRVTRNILYGDPVFASEVSTDALYLQPAALSPLINAGTNSGAPTTDILGVDRPQGGIVDIGAYEWAGTFDGSNFRAHNIETDIYYNRVETALNGISADSQTIELYAYTNKEPEIRWPSRNNITLRGASGTNSANVVMSGDKKNRIFMIDKPVSLSMTGLSIVDGYVTGNNGGAVYCTPNTVMTMNISNVIISGNAVTGNGTQYGGAFYASSANILLTDALIINNRTVGYAGFAANGVWTIDRAMFIGNGSGSNGGWGGLGWNGIWTVSNSSFSNNDARYGAIGYRGSWSIANSTIVNGGATYGGVGAYGTWILNNCIITGNIASSYGGVAYDGQWTANNCIFNLNKGGDQGGIASSGTWNVTNCIFDSNRASPNVFGSGFGGVFYSLNSLRADNSIFSNNSAAYYGGALSACNSAIIKNCTFAGNSGEYVGGGVARGGSYSIVNSIFWNNKDKGVVRNDFISCTLVSLNTCSVATLNFISGNTTVVTRNLIVGDPKFQSEVSSDTKFLRLSFGSLAVNSGTSNVSVTADMAGTPRGLYGAYDLGAYEYDNVFLSEYSPAKSSTSNIVSPRMSMRVQDYSHQSTDVALTINVNGAAHTDWTVATVNSTATTDMYIILDLSSLAYGSTINVTVNGQCPSINMFNDVYWFTIDIPPVITPYDPTANATMIKPWVTVLFDVTDNMSVSVSSVMVTFNRTEGTQLAVNGGAAGVSYNVGFNPITNGYRVSINHDIRFALAETVTVSILAKDNNGNPTTISYVFQIIDDFSPPSPAYGLRAVASPNVRVELSWQHADQGDVAVFRIYRVQSTSPAGEGIAIATTNGTVMTYNDATVATPNSYYYYVKAEDVYWNEGDKSNYAGAPHIKVTSRNYTVQSPNGYSGAGADLVPGAKVSFITKLVNDGYSPATETEFKDAIPAHTHYVTGSVYSSAPATINFQHEVGGVFDAEELDDVLQLRWQLQDMIEPYQERAVSFSVTVD